MNPTYPPSPVDRASMVETKFLRANEHSKALNDWLNDFFNGNNYALHLERNEQALEVDVVGGLITAPPFREWSALLGDTLHNYRCVLDHLVWQLSDIHSGPAPAEPIPRNNPWRGIAYPVVLNEDHWQDAIDTKLWAVDPTLHAVFKATQPFTTGPSAPEREPLALLERLWNIDKHRRIHFTEIWITLDDLSIHDDDGTFRTRMLGTHIHRIRPDERFDTEAVIARLLFLDGVPDGEVQMDHDFTVEVTLEMGAPSFGVSLWNLLESLNIMIGVIGNRLIPVIGSAQS